MVPGAASAGLVAPIVARTMAIVSAGPSSTMTRTGERVMNVKSSPKKGFPSCSA